LIDLSFSPEQAFNLALIEMDKIRERSNGLFNVGDRESFIEKVERNKISKETE
jgi:hypothetical protein